MPEASILLTVAAIVVACLVVWVGVVLKTAKQPWSRQPTKAVITHDGKNPLVDDEDEAVGTKAEKAEPKSEPEPEAEPEPAAKEEKEEA